jgi:hypothetical protein
MRDHRTDVIVQLLERMHELLDPVRAGNGDGQTGMLLMPHSPDCAVTRSSPPRCSCALRSLVELERLLRVMRDSGHDPLNVLPSGERVSTRTLWWNLNERYLRCETALREVTWRSGRWQLSHGSVVAQPGGWEQALVAERSRRRQRGIPVRVLVVTWHPGVDEARVAAGVGWLAANWGLPVEPMLPREVLAA